MTSIILSVAVAAANLAGAAGPARGNLSIGWDADAICLGRVKSVESNISVPLIPRGATTPTETIQCAILHIEVEGCLIGDVPQEVTVLASERRLRSWGFTSNPAKAPTDEARLRSAKPRYQVTVGPAIPELQCIVGFHGLVQLEKAGSDGGFYRNSRDFIRERNHADNPKFPAVSVAYCAGVTYALHSFDYDGLAWALYQTPTTHFDSSLPQGLRLLDFLASDLLSGDPFQQASLQELRQWNPLDKVPERPWFSDMSVPTIQAWFRSRFADQNLTATQRADQDILCLRADWGDQAAYTRFKAVTLKRGRPAKWMWLPRQSDPDLLLSLAVKAGNEEEVRAIFSQLQQHPEAKAKILAASAKMLGKSWMADQGILECLYKLTGNPALNPSDEKGMKRDLSTCLRAARQELQKCGAN